MKRIDCTPRPDFRTKVQELGLTWHSSGNEYWHETCYYEFTEDQVNTIFEATEKLHSMCIEAVQYSIDNPDKLVTHFQIPEAYVPYVVNSWNDESFVGINYGRFDLAYNGSGFPKLLEYNADTPTSLLESAVIQHFWKDELFPESDQFNSIWEHFVRRYGELKTAHNINRMAFAFSPCQTGEDAVTTSLHADMAAEAGIFPSIMQMGELGINNNSEYLLDMKNDPIYDLFKLYPWDWMFREDFAVYLPILKTRIYDPAWKVILSNKALLPVLSYLFPDSPYLLKSSFNVEDVGKCYAIKPIMSREGQNVALVSNGATVSQTGGEYDHQLKVYQELYELPKFGDHYPVIGSWVVHGHSCGIGIREDGLITSNTARFTPHLIK